MTKNVAVLLGAGFVGLVIVIVLLISILINRPEFRDIEIIAHKNTQVFKRLPGMSERRLGVVDEVPLPLRVEVGASVILKYVDKEKTFLPEAWAHGKIIWRPESGPVRPKLVTVAVNAVPWAEVFIKPPGTDRFTRPPGKESNITPVRGGLKLPIGTTIKLVYGDNEKTFGYEEWRTRKNISHDFLEP